MTIGVEEEFIVVDPENFFYAPCAPQILLKLISKDKVYLAKSSLESPFARGRFSFCKREDLKKGFSIVEVKTSPHKCIDSLGEEVKFNRDNLIEAVNDLNLALLPTGIHPLFSKKNCGLENTAALHIHITNNEKSYYNILGCIPQIISLTANSPFVEGKFLAMSSRALHSRAIGVPNNFFERTSDLIVNQHFKTIEVRACDTQLFSNDVIGVAATILCIAQKPICKKIRKFDYIRQRREAINNGRQNVETEMIFKEIATIADELSLSDYITEFFRRKTGAELQLECYRQYGIPSLLPSLWDSMKRDYFIVGNSISTINTTINENNFLYYLFIYSPLFFWNLLKKIRQDDAVHTTELLGSDPSKIVTSSLYKIE